ncbi:MAG: T9SS type A sorting domain-containing protein [candidate division Zixibacteria bacterium]|nr:T9SS type A sorting domain-containing protein [candidate division Zixibacteria bacterium]MDH4033800.1 T9SS type A sorting domain-containing protein [candidate division Zixibacteria bacterium]
MCKYTLSLLFVAAAMLAATPAAQAGTFQDKNSSAKTVDEGRSAKPGWRYQQAELPEVSSQDAGFQDERDDCSSVYYYNDSSSNVFIWPLPQDSVDWLAVRFDNDGASECTLKVARVTLNRGYMAGAPDLQIGVFDDDGFGLPGSLLASETVPYDSLPTGNYGWAEADFSSYNLVFGTGENYHIGVSVIPQVGDTLFPVSDVGDGVHSGEQRSTYQGYGVWSTIYSATGTDYVFWIEAEMCCSIIECVPPPAGMVAWWPLDETSGQTSDDIAGAANNAGTWMNSPIPVTGKVDGALSFNGSNSVDVPNDPELNFGTSDYSVDLWIKSTDVSTTPSTILDKRTGSVPNITGYVLFLYNGYLGSQIGDGSGYMSWTSTGFVADGNWHHVAVTVDRDNPSGWLYYVDGSAVGPPANPTAYQGSLTNTAPLVMARNLVTPGHVFTGTLDEIELFNRVLDPLEIYSIWEADSFGKCKDTCYADGDANGDGIFLSVADLVYLIAYLNGAGPAPPIPYKADLTGDGVIDGGDVQLYKNYFIYGIGVFPRFPVPCPCDPVLAPAAVYLHSVDGGGGRGPGEVIAGLPFIMNIGLRNYAETNATSISHGLKIYSPDGAIWEPPMVGYLESFPAESFFDVTWTGDFECTGSGVDTVAFSAQATSLSGLPQGYDDAVFGVASVVNHEQIGKTICIDSTFFPPDGAWQWETSLSTVEPVWGGPYCFDILGYAYDTVLAYGALMTSVGTAELGVNPDSSVSVSNLGDGGTDGVRLGFGEALTATIGFGGPDLIPAKGAIAVFCPLGLEYMCCWNPADPHKNCLYPGTDCYDLHQCVVYGKPKYWGVCEPAFEVMTDPMRGPEDLRCLIFVPPGSDSATVRMDGYHDAAGFTLYVYEGGGLVDSVDCESGTDIITGRAMPTAMSVGEMSALTWTSSMDFAIEGGGVLHGDELRSRPHSATRTDEVVSRVIVLGAGLSEFVIDGVETISCCELRGDFTHNGQVDISDLVDLVDYMFTGGPAPLCDEEADLNGDGGIDIADLVYMVDFMFTGGPAPVPCDQPAPVSRVVGKVSNISFDIEYADGISTVIMNSPIDLRGIQLELKGAGPVPENLVGEHVDMVHGRDGWVVKVGLLDLDGSEVVTSDVTRIIRFEGEYTLESVIVADEQARSITPTIGQSAKRNELPTDYALGQNYPNPFNPNTSIAFALPEATEVMLEVYNLLGQRVKTLINRRLEAGHHAAVWDSRNESGQTVSSGVYFYRMETPNYMESRKMVLLK